MNLRAATLSLCVVFAACTSNTIDPNSDTDPGPGSTAAASETTNAGQDSDPIPMTSVGPVDTESTVDGGSVDTSGALDFGSIDPNPLLLHMAIETNFAPGIPLQAIVTATPRESDTGLVVDLTLQWLSLDQGSTTSPRLPIGDIYNYPDVPLDEEFGFVWDAGVLLVPAEANPITGSDLVGSLQIVAVAEGSGFCGRVNGMVIKPIRAPLKGSTHAMAEIAAVDALPLEFPVSCP